MKGPSRGIQLTALVAALVACGLVSAAALEPGQPQSLADQLKLPPDLAKYKEWRALLQSPEPVPLELWIRCVAPTISDWNQARKEYGPHAEHFIQVYANQIAAKQIETQILRHGKTGTFLMGAVIAKEKLMNSPEGTVAGIAFMIKRGTPQFASTGGWEFAYYPQSRDSASIQACALCHRAAAPTDYVFGQYPHSGDPLHPPPDPLPMTNPKSIACI